MFVRTRDHWLDFVLKQGSFYALQDWIKEIKRYGPGECVVAIAGNKCDLEDQREVSKN